MNSFKQIICLLVLLAIQPIYATNPAAPWATLQYLASLSDQVLFNSFISKAPNQDVTWDDNSCPTILVNGELLVCGNLLVRGRIQVLSSVNLSTYELQNQQGSIREQKLSKFLLNRCSKDPCNGQGAPCNRPVTGCPFRGDLIVSSSSLVIAGGSITVLGTVIAEGLFLDGASDAAINVGEILGARALRSKDKHLQPIRAKEVLPAIDDRASKDSFCLVEDSETLAALIPHGMIYLKGSSRLWTFGKVTATIIGIDRGSSWFARCGEISTRGKRIGDEEDLGDMSLLASAKFVKTGFGPVQVEQLVVSEASVLIMLDGSLEARSVIKVSLKSRLEIRDGTLRTSNAFISDGGGVWIQSQNTMNPALQANELMMLLDGGIVKVSCSAATCLIADTIELYDGSQLTVASGNVRVLGHAVFDGGVTAEIEGKITVEETLYVANSSHLSSHNIAVREDIVAKNHAVINVTDSIHVGCSLWIEQRSTIKLSNKLLIRAQVKGSNGFTTNRNKGNYSTSHILCEEKHSPSLFINNGVIGTPKEIQIGAKHQTEERNRTQTIIVVLRSSIEAGRINLWHVSSTPKKGVVLLLRKGSTISVKGGGGLRIISLPVSLCSLESGSSITVDGAEGAELGTLEVLDRSNVTIKGGSLQAVAIELQSSSSLTVEGGELFTLSSYLEAGGNSEVRLRIKQLMLPEGFSYWLATSGSSTLLRSVTPMVLRGTWVSQDRSTVKIAGLIDREKTEASMNAETKSLIQLDRVNGARLTMARTSDSEIQTDHLNEDVRVYSLVVPPSNAADLEAFYRQSPLKSKSKNGFWDVMINQENGKATINNTIFVPVELNHSSWQKNSSTAPTGGSSSSMRPQRRAQKMSTA